MIRQGRKGSSMGRFKGTKGIIILVLLVCLVLGYYFHLSNSRGGQNEDMADVEILTMSQKALNRNLESNYPPSPREVVKYFSEITQCFYNEEHTEEELRALGLKALEIYDDELVANQTVDEYLYLLEGDVEEYREKNRTVASFELSSSIDVEKFTEDGYDWARLYCIYNIKEGTLTYQTTVCFILRMDENSHYKIYGWRKVDEEG